MAHKNRDSVAKSSPVTGVGLAILLVLLTGCPDPPPPTLLIITLDETASFVESGNWDASVLLAQSAVALLRPRDKVCVIGLDHHGFDQDDMRIALTALPAGALPATQVKKTLIEQIGALEPRPTSSGALTPEGVPRGLPKGTDTRAALDQAAHLASFAGEARVKLLVFTDFQDEPGEGPRGGLLHGSAFPPSTRFKAMFVVEKEGEGAEQWYDRRDKWIEELGRRSISCDAQDFLTPGLSKAEAVKAYMRELPDEIRGLDATCSTAGASKGDCA